MTQEEVLPPTHRFETRCRLCFADEDEQQQQRSSSSSGGGNNDDGVGGYRLFPDAHHPAARRAAELVEMILECTSIQITLEEDYPAKVCEKCVETLDKFYQYRRRCLLNDQILRSERQAVAAAAATGKSTTTSTGHKHDGSVAEGGSPPDRQRLQQQHRSSPSPQALLPAIRIKSEPSPSVDRLDEEEEEEEGGARSRGTGGERTGESLEDHHPSAGARIGPNATENAESGGTTSSILRSILLQTRDSTTSRSSPNTESGESPRQTPQPQPAPPRPPSATPSVVGGAHGGNASSSSPLLAAPVDETRQSAGHPATEEDVKPSLLQQMLLQHGSPARSPTKAGPSGGCAAGGSTDGLANSPGSGPLAGSGGGGGGRGASSSLLKRMLLDGSGTTTSHASGGEQAPLEGTSHQRTKHEPMSATGTPSPPAGGAPDDEVPTAETPLASQLRSILLQHRAAAMVRSESLAAAHLHRHQQQQQHDAKQDIFEKPEVSYIRSLFLRNDSDSDGEPPPTEDQRELLLYTMFQELRARQQEQQQQHQHQQHQGFSSDSDDSDDLPQDYRLPCVRRRSTESLDSRSSSHARKRRRMEYPCLLCGRSFAGRTKLVMHMRTHMMPPAPSTASSPLTGPPPASGLQANGGHGAEQQLDANSTAPPAPSPLLAAAAAATTATTRGRSYHNDDSSPQAAASVNHHPADGGQLLLQLGNDAGNDDDEIDALERRSYACYICGADQNNLHQLKEHLLAAHQDRIRSRGRTRERQRASIGCEICHRQFRSQFAYGEHMRTHTGERPFPCDQCDKRFPRRFQLLGHLFNVHKQSWVADESKAKFAKK